MEANLLAYLQDVLGAIDEIYTFTKNHETFDDFKNDLKSRRAVERNIEIIGEAVNRVLNKNENIDISFAREIVDTRNRIIHGYDKVSNKILWGIIETYIPVLENEVVELLDQIDSTQS